MTDEEAEVTNDLIGKLIIAADARLAEFERRTQARVTERIDSLEFQNRILGAGVILAVVLGLFRLR